MATKKVIVQKSVSVSVSHESQRYTEPPQYFSSREINMEFYEGSLYTIRNTITQSNRTTQVDVTDNDFYLRFGFGKWRIYGGDPATGQLLYTWEEDENPSWLTVSGSDRFLSLSYPLRMSVEIEIPDDGNDEFHISQAQQIGIDTTITVWVFRKGENYTPPPFPYDPNNPNPPQPPQGELKLWCKVGGTVHRARKLYIKQNGILIPVKKIIGG